MLSFPAQSPLSLDASQIGYTDKVSLQIDTENSDLDAHNSITVTITVSFENANSVTEDIKV